MIKNKFLKALVFSVGSLSLILGLIGIFLPILPTTPFVILAAACFVKSSPKVHAWLYKQKVIGKVLKDWEENGVIARPTKIQAVIMIAVSLLIIWLTVEILMVKIAVSVLLCVVSGFIISRPEK